MREEIKTPEGKIEEKVLHINRPAKVVKGGRRFSFSALVAAGNRAGKVGYGLKKANEVSDAIRKGGDLARKSLITFATKGDTIPHSVLVKEDGVTLFIKPAPKGTGILAGSQVRVIFELAGIKDVVARLRGSNNPNNQVRALFKALAKLTPRETILLRRKRKEV